VGFGFLPRSGWKDADIAEATCVSSLSVERIRKRFVEEGLESAINPKVSKRAYSRKLDGENRDIFWVTLLLGELSYT